MSIVIIGGNERMVCQYSDICKDYGCKAKVFPKEHGSVRKKRSAVGSHDPVYQYGVHKMVITAARSETEQRTHRPHPYQQRCRR